MYVLPIVCQDKCDGVKCEIGRPRVSIVHEAAYELKSHMQKTLIFYVAYL